MSKQSREEYLVAQRDAYETFVNRIDDYFEYRGESDKDKAFVSARLDKLAARLEEIHEKMGKNLDS